MQVKNNMELPKEQIEHFDCDCNSPEHTLRFMYMPPYKYQNGLEEGELYTEVYLQQYRNVFKRIWIALKYIFGYKCRYGHFDCTIIKKEDYQRFKRLIDKVIQDKDNIK
jgi:hypothetical protein